jgi:hypothetical protein
MVWIVLGVILLKLLEKLKVKLVLLDKAPQATMLT